MRERFTVLEDRNLLANLVYEANRRIDKLAGPDHTAEIAALSVPDLEKANERLRIAEAALPRSKKPHPTTERSTASSTKRGTSSNAHIKLKSNLTRFGRSNHAVISGSIAIRARRLGQLSSRLVSEKQSTLAKRCSVSIDDRQSVRCMHLRRWGRCKDRSADAGP